MRVARFKPGDMDGIQFDLRERSTIEDAPLDSVETFTFRNKGKVVSIAGFYELRDGVYSMWACQTKGVACLSYARMAKRLLMMFIKDYHPRLIYLGITTVPDVRWAKFLGFEYEYTMKDFYAEGEDLMGYKLHG